jgi:hypothetical protein
MLSMACALSIAALAFPVPAARIQDRTHLTAIDILAMQGKTMAITLHAPSPYIRTDFGASLAGALVHPALAQVEDEDFRARNNLTDPSVAARDLLATALRDAYGLQPRPVDTTQTDETRPKRIAALHPDADFILDVRTLLWQHRGMNKGFPRLALEFQLINVATRHTDAWMRCDTFLDNGIMPPPKSTPLFTALESDGGQMLRHAYSVLAARCVRKFASQRLLMLPEDQPATMALADLDPYVVPGVK